MRISDWSSDVCSSDLQRQVQPVRHVLHEAGLAAAGWTLDQHRHAMLPGLPEEHLFVAQRLVERDITRADQVLGRVHWQYLTAAVGFGTTLMDRKSVV